MRRWRYSLTSDPVFQKPSQIYILTEHPAIGTTMTLVSAQVGKSDFPARTGSGKSDSQTMHPSGYL